MVDDVIVLGGGSAGLLAALTLKVKLPAVNVTVVRSPEIGVIGVGEGTTAFMPSFLHGYLNLDLATFARVARPTFKLGVDFRWGPRRRFQYTFSTQFCQTGGPLRRPAGFYCRDDVEYASLNAALMTHDRVFAKGPDGSLQNYRDVAYHLENADFVRYLEATAGAAGVAVRDDTVGAVEPDGAGGVRTLVCGSGNRYAADLFVDCSGFRSTLLGQALGEPFVPYDTSLFCDRAVVGGWDRTAAEPVHPYTTAQTMDHGWSWQIEHERRVNRGYVYSSAFTTDAGAEAEFRRVNPRLTETRVLRFASGRRERAWVGNVVGIGNAYGFVEPLESTSLTMICQMCRGLATALTDADRDPTPGDATAFNRWANTQWDQIRAFLAVHYKYNTRLATPFWRACREATDVAGAAAFCDYYVDCGPTQSRLDAVLGDNPFGAEGWTCMMVGMAVPYRRPFTPTAAEVAGWEAMKGRNRARAAGGAGTAEVLARYNAFVPQPGQPLYTLE